MRNFLIRLLLKPETPRGALAQEQYEMALSKMYQNPAVMQYLDVREKYLTYKGMDQILNNKLDKAHGLAGQVLEVKALRLRCRACYNIKHKEMQRRKSPQSAT